MCIFVSVYECVPVGIGGMAFGPDVNTSPGHRSRPFVHDVCPIPASLTITSDHLRLVLGSVLSDLGKF